MVMLISADLLKHHAHEEETVLLECRVMLGGKHPLPLYSMAMISTS